MFLSFCQIRQSGLSLACSPSGCNHKVRAEPGIAALRWRLWISPDRLILSLDAARPRTEASMPIEKRGRRNFESFEICSLCAYSSIVRASEISAALRKIVGESDPAKKALLLASLCSTVFRQHGFELVVVGGSAIELLTEGAYMSGDLDLCNVGAPMPSLRQRQELMGKLGARGGPRHWQVAGMFVDLLGTFESLARTPLRKLEGPYGLVQVMQPEELLVERVLVSVYPGPYEPARLCAKKLAAVALGGALEIDWNEVRRLANRPEYKVFGECKKLLKEVANELKVKSPFDTH